VAFKYALPGPPFNFLGNFSETQRDNFKAWIAARTANFSAIKLHHQMRAQQLRKTAGVLELFYAKTNDQPLTTTFLKPSWQPGSDGHFNYSFREDQLPMVTVSKIKARFKEQLQRDEEGVFFMNFVRNTIESHEDEAQFANDVASDTNKENLKSLLQNIDTYFGQEQYQATLVGDQNDLYKGMPRFRVHQLDTPTQWELEQANHSSPDTPISIKQVDPEQDRLP
jgi:hypothetical protein